MLRIATLLIVLAACPAPASTPGPAPTPTEPTPTTPPTPTPPTPTQSGAALTSKDACTTDADCTITMFSGCCACPGCDQPSVHSTKELAAAQQVCQAVRCDMERCKTMMCKPGEPAETFTAACQNNVCIGLRK